MSFQLNDYVRVEKIGSVDEPRYRTPSWDEFEPGKDNDGMSLPVDYECTGHLGNLPEVGQPLLLYRDTRNGIEVPGILRTSYVKKITKAVGDVPVLLLDTENSQYRVTRIPPREAAIAGETEWKA